MKLHEIKKVQQQQLDELNWKQVAVVAASLLLGASSPNYIEKVSQAATQVSKQVNQAAERIAELAEIILSKYRINNERALEIASLAVQHEKNDFPKAEDILAVIGIESSFNPNAVSKLAKDPARGLMQVRPGIWGITPDDLATPEQQVKFGVDVLHKYYQKLGDPEDALHAYNIGITNFRKGQNLNPKYVAKYKNERELY